LIPHESPELSACELGVGHITSTRS
jgi:hypothetical protein